ncbi:xyloglucan O-acetyltransferase 1 isoform X2 [Rhodamnia argentea]|uniref:Xyloglucan O-acetyltransferase 1 isoform X2 n=1 Tax=Rhodamnia argentea TaxID=178133 RepID=A0ABM3HGX1_9MYRT|nr:xyloglucan O-acetyltransferase 1 isoform X2 [Rhodamnia argentea]
MGGSSPFKDQNKQHSTTTTTMTTFFSFWRFLPYTIYAILPMALFRVYFYPLPVPQSPTDRLPRSDHILVAPSLSSPRQAEKAGGDAVTEAPPPPPPPPCDYASGKWVPDKSEPLYNGTTCVLIRDAQNCIAHGRPDLDYLYWRWKPHQCHLPRFQPIKFLQLVRNKNVAFVGDSLARNQLESLVCMLSTVSDPILVYRDGEDNKFRKWNFPGHNMTISAYWSPFLVKGEENFPDYNKLYLDSVNERWAGDLGSLDMVVLSFGHWFVHPAVYFEGGSALGCHYCTGLNHTEIGFYGVLRKALRTSLKALIARTRASGRAMDVLVTMFPPAHFEGDWDKFGSCPKTKPYQEGEKLLEGMDAEMRKSLADEVEAAKADARDFSGIRLEALDITKLSLMRPDGHPGPYIFPFPFADGVKDRVQNDCVHWCLPGPIDTWNAILLEAIKRWRGGEMNR